MGSPSPSPTIGSPSPPPTTVPCRRYQNPSKKRLNPSFSDLPSSLLEIIMSHLVLKDNIRASAACKSWHEAATCVRVVDKHPWLLYFPKSGGTLIKLHDPLECKSYTLNLPELAKSTVCYSKDGWLFMHRSSSSKVFFFNPFSRELISLPKFMLPFQKIAFSCPPTSDNCVVVALTQNPDRRIIRSTCHPGATEWITKVSHDSFPPFDMHTIVYLNDRFFCFGEGYLHYFHPSSRNWFYRDVRYLYHQQQQRSWEETSFFLAEKKGELFLINTCGNEKPMVYKLVSYEWTKMRDINLDSYINLDSDINLDGLTMFVSFYNSELRSDLPWMRNNVYFSRFGNNRKRCVSYSFDKSAYNTRKDWQNGLELCPPHCLWIDPPKNVLDFL